MRVFITWCILSFLLIPAMVAVAEPQLDITTVLMRSTFKIQGEKSLGTVFIMGEISPKDPSRVFFILITAAHVLEEIKSDTAILHLRQKKGDEFSRLPYKIQLRTNGKPLWMRHPQADIAAMRVRLPKKTDFKLLSTTLLASDEMLEKFQIRPGDQLMVLGFPLGAEANEYGFPILRSGRVASYPLTPTEKTKTFLLDFEIFKGNSGGPVVFYDEHRIYQGSTHIGTVKFIMGVVSREKGLKERIESINKTEVRMHKLGLAEVVHASFVAELIKMLPPIPN